MARRTKDDWRQLIEQQAQSQLSIAEFCRQQDIPRPGTLWGQVFHRALLSYLLQKALAQ